MTRSFLMDLEKYILSKMNLHGKIIPKLQHNKEIDLVGAQSQDHLKWLSDLI